MDEEITLYLLYLSLSFFYTWVVKKKVLEDYFFQVFSSNAQVTIIIFSSQCFEGVIRGLNPSLDRHDIGTHSLSCRGQCCHP